MVSGGQTGVDRAALDWALAHAVPCGGWCPRGRLAEDGPIPMRYPLRETPSDGYAERTRWNVRDSDGSLIITRGAPTGGTAYTIDCAGELGRPVWVVDVGEPLHADAVWRWGGDARIDVVNVAGPRESTSPGIYAAAMEVLEALFGA